MLELPAVQKNTPPALCLPLPVNGEGLGVGFRAVLLSPNPLSACGEGGAAMLSDSLWQGRRHPANAFVFVLYLSLCNL